MKKQFIKPEIKVVEIDETQIICDSIQAKASLQSMDGVDWYIENLE